MSILTIINIIKFTKSINRLIILVKKIIRRFLITTGNISNDENINFLEKNCENIDNFFSNIDKKLWNESKIFQNELKVYSEKNYHKSNMILVVVVHIIFYTF